MVQVRLEVGSNSAQLLCLESPLPACVDEVATVATARMKKLVQVLLCYGRGKTYRQGR